MKVLYVLLFGLLPVAALRAALPLEVTVTKPTQFELMRDGHPKGSISLEPGAKLEVIDLADDYLLVRYRNANGRVRVSCTDLSPDAMSDEPVPPVAHPKPGKKPPPAAVPAAPATPPHIAANALERALAGKLVHLEGGALRPFDAARLAGVKFYAIYFSASWCPPCREFTPGLVDAYGKIRELYPEFELVLVNRDRSAQDMEAYMRGDGMQWPALGWDAIRFAGEINRYAGEGIPDLVLVNENGQVLSDSFRDGSYVGPDTVLDDTWKILRDYRRQNLRRKF
jgi:nucleoredoxin